MKYNQLSSLFKKKCNKPILCGTVIKAMLKTNHCRQTNNCNDYALLSLERSAITQVEILVQDLNNPNGQLTCCRDVSQIPS